MKEIEKRIDAYFSSLRIPMEATKFDFLLLSLRERMRFLHSTGNRSCSMHTCEVHTLHRFPGYSSFMAMCG